MLEQVVYEIVPVGSEIESIEVDHSGFGYATPFQGVHFTQNAAGTRLFAALWGREDSEELRAEICAEAQRFLPLDPMG